MDIFSSLQNILGQAAGFQSNSTPQSSRAGGSGLDALGGLFDSNMLGGLLSALVSGKGGASSASGVSASAMGESGGLGALGGLLGALMGGQGGQEGVLSQLLPQDAPAPASRASVPVTPQNRAINLVRTLVYAAKADGHIDEREQSAINGQIGKLGLGAQAQAMISQVMDESIDPNRIASNVGDTREAVQLYALSCALTNMDQFMERSYLDGLAIALRIPADARAQIEAKVSGR